METKYEVNDRVRAALGPLQGREGFVCEERFEDIYTVDFGVHGKHDFRGAALALATAVRPGPIWTPGLPPDSDSAARKRAPMFAGLVGYFPDALAEEAKVSFEGGQKHTPGEPLRWAREKSTDHADCIIRHAADYAKHLAEARAAQETQTPAPTREMIEDMAKIAWRAHAQCQVDVEAARVGGAT